jgi:hypothetical protein
MLTGLQAELRRLGFRQLMIEICDAPDIENGKRFHRGQICPRDIAAPDDAYTDLSP